MTQEFSQQPVSTEFWSNTAIGGQDTTAYYKTVGDGHSPIKKATARYTILWEETEWHFAPQKY